MDHNGTDIIRVPGNRSTTRTQQGTVGLRFKGLDLFACVPVDDSELEIITTAYNPVLSFDESAGPYGDIGEFKCLDDGLCFVRPDMCVSVV